MFHFIVNDATRATCVRAAAWLPHIPGTATEWERDWLDAAQTILDGIADDVVAIVGLHDPVVLRYTLISEPDNFPDGIAIWACPVPGGPRLGFAIYDGDNIAAPASTTGDPGHAVAGFLDRVVADLNDHFAQIHALHGATTTAITAAAVSTFLQS